MKAMKLGLVVSLVALSFIGCGTDATNNNANPSANRNGSPSPTVAPPATSSGATANANSPAGPGSGSGNAPAPATNANTAATAAGNSNAAGGATAVANVDAAALFNTGAAPKCASCHGADGKGNPNIKKVPNFTDPAWQKKTTDADMIETIKNGDKPMPAYKDKLNEQEIKALVAYVRSFAK
jgi:mono/diheme cytochrome c family protein